MNKTIAFIGSGKIVNSMIQGIISNNYLTKNIIVSSPTNNNRLQLKKKYNIISTNNNVSAMKKSDIIIFSVKPESVKDVCQDFKKIKNFNEKILLTTIAGVSTKTYQKYIDSNLKITRIMPNILSSIQEGTTALFSTKIVLQEEKKIIENFTKLFGKILWMNQENEIDMITSIIGSGPAYFFHFMELIQKKFEKLGFNSKTIKTIIAQIAKGSSILVLKNLNVSFLNLKKKVCSKNGITIEALKEFDKCNLKKIISNSIQAVINKTKKIKNNYFQMEK